MCFSLCHLCFIRATRASVFVSVVLMTALGLNFPLLLTVTPPSLNVLLHSSLRQKTHTHTHTTMSLFPAAATHTDLDTLVRLSVFQFMADKPDGCEEKTFLVITVLHQCVSSSFHLSGLSFYEENYGKVSD